MLNRLRMVLLNPCIDASPLKYPSPEVCPFIHMAGERCCEAEFFVQRSNAMTKSVKLCKFNLKCEPLTIKGLFVNTYDFCCAQIIVVKNATCKLVGFQSNFAAICQGINYYCKGFQLASSKDPMCEVNRPLM